MKKTPPKSTITTRAADESLGRRLTEALSDDELQLVLVRALLALDEAGRQRLLEGVDAETRAALTLALTPQKKGSSHGAATPFLAGRRKLQQEWEVLWAQWDAIIAKSGDEKGEYVLQENDWDAPSLDLGAVADDLEAVGAEFRAMMPAVIAADLSPDLRFSEILDDLGDDLGAGLPEWIEAPDGDDFVLGPETSSLVLEWDWTMESAKGVGLAEFLDERRDVEERLSNVSLHEQSIRDFVMAQPEPALRAFLESVTRQRASPRWLIAFTAARGVWAELLRELTARWDPALFAETSRANIVHDWTLALPLVKDAIAHKRFDEAATLIDEAVRARLRLEPKQHWDPRATLLAHADRAYVREEHEPALATLLGLWKKVAEARGEGDVVVALTLQLAALAGADLGEVMLKAFDAVPARFQAVRDALFAEWRSWFVARTLSQRRDAPAVACGQWVAALVDAADAGAEGTKGFHAAVRATLAEARTMKQPPRDARHSMYLADRVKDPLFALAVLTLDLDAARPTVAKSAPRLFELLKASLEGGQATLEQSRRRWVARLGGAALIPELVEFWRENAARFVPDPGGFTANYTSSADWLAAVHEVDPGVAAALLSRWADVHRRKRNLWRDLAQRGLPAR